MTKNFKNDAEKDGGEPDPIDAARMASGEVNTADGSQEPAAASLMEAVTVGETDKGGGLEGSDEVKSEALLRLPILPLRGTVVFPLTVVPLAAAQARSLLLIDDVMSGDRIVGLARLRARRGRGRGARVCRAQERSASVRATLGERWSIFAPKARGMARRRSMAWAWSMEPGGMMRWV